MNTQMFIDRERELDFLNRQEEERPSLAVIYGRRRVGKSSLVEKFCQGKNHLYYTASESNKKEQLDEIYSLASEKLEDRVIQDLKHSWETLLRYLKDKDLILVLDEFPYIINSDPSIPSKIKRIWDEELRNSNIFLILTGSSVSMMEDEVISPKSPLYGRRTGQWKLEPFGFTSSQKFFPKYSIEDKIRAFAVLGGIPYFLEQFDPDKPVIKNISRSILNKGSVLYNEVEFLMREELREPRNYYTTLRSVSQGNTKFSDIQNDTGIAKNSLTSYLSILRNLHLIKRRTPITKKNSKKGRYYLEDNFFRFWFRYIFPNKSQLETDKELLLGKIEDTLDHYVSFIFEDVCREYVNIDYTGYEVGRWWYKEDEIDIVSLNERENEALFAECKWSKNPVNISLLHSLKEKAKKVRWNNDNRKEHYAIFSRSGFEEDIKEGSDSDPNIQLYDLDDMKQVFE
ncbi:MAG: ATP-binding protein [Thermoplasmatota archaeon]